MVMIRPLQLISAIQTTVAGIAVQEDKLRSSGLILTVPNPAISPVYIPAILE